MLALLLLIGVLIAFLAIALVAEVLEASFNITI
jgi:hypothetical protein